MTPAVLVGGEPSRLNALATKLESRGIYVARRVSYNAKAGTVEVPAGTKIVIALCNLMSHGQWLAWSDAATRAGVPFVSGATHWSRMAPVLDKHGYTEEAMLTRPLMVEGLGPEKIPPGDVVRRRGATTAIVVPAAPAAHDTERPLEKKRRGPGITDPVIRARAQASLAVRIAKLRMEATAAAAAVIETIPAGHAVHSRDLAVAVTKKLGRACSIDTARAALRAMEFRPAYTRRGVVGLVRGAILHDADGRPYRWPTALAPGGTPAAPPVRIEAPPPPAKSAPVAPIVTTAAAPRVAPAHPAADVFEAAAMLREAIAAAGGRIKAVVVTADDFQIKGS